MMKNKTLEPAKRHDILGTVNAGSRVLCGAASYGTVKMVDVLLKQNVQLYVSANQDLQTPLIAAVVSERDSLDKVKQIVAYSRGCLPSVVLSDSKNSDVLQSMSRFINAQNKGGHTALMIACRLGKTNIVKFLVASGADVWVKNKVQSIALILAMRKSVSLCGILLDKMKSDITDNTVHRQFYINALMVVIGQIKPILIHAKDDSRVAIIELQSDLFDLLIKCQQELIESKSNIQLNEKKRKHHEDHAQNGSNGTSGKRVKEMEGDSSDKDGSDSTMSMGV
jgi:hypothetical protein